MQKYFFLLAISVVLLFSSCQKKLYQYSNTWSTKSVNIDGQLDEWQLPLEQPAAQIPIKYRCSNDEKYLYLAVQASDEYMKAMFLHQGLKIWIDSTARRKEKNGIGYPIPLRTSETNELASEAGNNTQKFIELYAASMQEFDVYGLADESLRLSNLTSKEIKVALAFDQLRTLCMEIRIPIKTVLGSFESGKIFSLGIAVNNPSKSIDDGSNDSSLFNDRNQNQITQGNPLMGPNSQMMNQNMNPNNMNQMQGPSRQLSMPNIWMKIKLADKAE
jgi:hypothetical protein